MFIFMLLYSYFMDQLFATTTNEQNIFFIMRSIFRIIVLLTNEFPWFNNKKRPKGDYIFFLFSISYRDRQFFLLAVYSLVSKIVYLNHVFHTKDCGTIKKHKQTIEKQNINIQWQGLQIVKRIFLQFILWKYIPQLNVHKLSENEQHNFEYSYEFLFLLF